MGGVMGGMEWENNAQIKTFENHLLQFEEDFHSKTPLYDADQITFPLSTQGIKIVDKTGRRVKLNGVNWSGGHMCRHCPDGLQFRRLEQLCTEIRQFGFNCVRLTYSLQLIYDNNVIPERYLKANPNLKGKRALEVFDIVVKELTKAGLMVILNNHTSSSMWCCSTSDGQGLWWTYKYPQYLWLDHFKLLGQRYGSNQRVIGFDLRNELRDTPDHKVSWGDGVPTTDWRRAAILGCNEVFKVCPHMIVMVSGLNFSLDLSDLLKKPIMGSELRVQNKLIYTGHFYGFSWPIPTWRLVSYNTFKKKLFSDQLAIRALGVPFFLGEFGTNTPDIPWQYLIKFLGESDIDWTYWPLDGFKCEPDKDETYGIYNRYFSGVRHQWLLKDLQKLHKPQSRFSITFQMDQQGQAIIPGKQPVLDQGLIIAESDGYRGKKMVGQELARKEQSEIVRSEPSYKLMGQIPLPVKTTEQSSLRIFDMSGSQEILRVFDQTLANHILQNANKK